MVTESPRYAPEFRDEAVRLVTSSGKPVAAIARDLGVSYETLRKWIKQAALDAGERQDGLTTEEHDELRRLRRENRILQEEREILKKPRPSSPRRPTRAGNSVRVRGAREGPQ